MFVGLSIWGTRLPLLVLGPRWWICLTSARGLLLFVSLFVPCFGKLEENLLQATQSRQFHASLAHTELELSACRAIYQGHECPGQPNACPRPCQSSSVCHFASQCPCPWQCQFNTRLLRVFAQPNAIRVQLCGVQKCLPGTNPPQKTYCQNVVIVGVFGWMEWIIAENKSLKSNKDFAVILRLPFIIVKYLLRPK